MKTYKSIYSFEVIEEIKKGEAVYMLDKKCDIRRSPYPFVEICNDITAKKLLAILSDATTDKTNRFLFWKEVEEVENEEAEGKEDE